jgi:hypothetical protein
MTISVTKETAEKIASGEIKAEGDEAKVLSYLANRFTEAEAEAKASSNDPNWIFNIWGHRI